MTSAGLGRLTEEEIASQPASWTATLRRCREYGERWAGATSATGEMVCVGCGTSYYLAEAAAAVWRGQTGQAARALPASELLLFPELYLQPDQPYRFLLFSRSGRTSEVVRLAEQLRARARGTVVAVTCRPESDLARAAEQSFGFPEGFDASVVMTRSFSSMLLAVIALTGTDASRGKDELATLPAAGERLLTGKLPDALLQPAPTQWVFLGQGPLFGLAREAALKMKEMALATSEAFHSLEQRHGPKSVVGEGSAVLVLSSEVSLEWEEALAQELVELGAHCLQVRERVSGGEREGISEIGLNSGLPLMQRLPLYILPCQQLALARARERGIDCDHPRALGAVVELAARPQGRP